MVKEIFFFTFCKRCIAQIRQDLIGILNGDIQLFLQPSQALEQAGVAIHCSTTIFNFQFRKILPTPKEVKSSDQCSFCKESSETLLHLFWEFPFAKSFWNEIISNWMENSSCFLNEVFSFSSYLGLVNGTTNLVFHQALLISSR